MDVEELLRALAVAGVAVTAVRAGSPAERAWCVRAAAPDDGDEGDAWEIFWTEGGERYAWTRFDEESTACFALLGRLLWARLLRGAPVPP